MFLRALPVAMAAQGIRDRSLPDVVEKALRSAGRRRVARVEDAVRAAQRACARWARWFGGIDTCLTRSLVAGALLAGDREVVLVVGFRPAESIDSADGHAWLLVDGEVVEPTGLDRDDGEPYEKVLELPMKARQGDRNSTSP